MNAILSTVLGVLAVAMPAPSQIEQSRDVDLSSPFLELARAAGWPDRPGAGDARVVREIWVTDSYPNYAGARVPFVRLIDRGQGFEAEFFLWWPREHSPLMPTSGPGIRCGDGATRKAVCLQAVPVPMQQNWNQVGFRFLGLPECRAKAPGTAGGVGDAGDLRMEIFDQGSYRTYVCNAPTTGSGYAPVVPEVVEMYQLLWQLQQSVPKTR